MRNISYFHLSLGSGLVASFFGDSPVDDVGLTLTRLDSELD